MAKYVEKNFTRTTHEMVISVPSFVKDANGVIDFSKTVQKQKKIHGVTADTFESYKQKYGYNPLAYMLSESDVLLVMKEQALYEFAETHPESCKFVPLEDADEIESEEE